MKKDNIYLVLVFLFFLVLIPTLSFAGAEIPGLYYVSSWELDVCSKWGGLIKPVSYVSLQGVEIVSGNTVISLLAEKTPIHLLNKTIVLYKFNWYIEPSRAMKITITAKSSSANANSRNSNSRNLAFSNSDLLSSNSLNSNLVEQVILDTDAQALAPITSYFTRYFDDDFDLLELNYGGSVFSIPIVEVD